MKTFKYTRKCKCCGKEFQTNSPQKLFCDDVHYLPCPVCGKPVLKKDRDFTRPPKCCSKECSWKLRKQNFKSKVCEICGEEFTPTSGVATICNKEHHIKCEICGKDMIITKDMWHDGIKTCSEECRKEKTRRFNQEKYGVDHPMQSKEVQQHHKDSMKEKYGVEFALQSQEFLDKASNTMKERYGVEWAQQSKSIKDQSLAKMIQKYGAPYTLQSADLRNKVESTNLERYGFKHTSQSPEIKSKIAKTCFEKYNAGSYIYSAEFRSKFRAISQINMRFKQMLESAGCKVSVEFPLHDYRYDLICNDNILIEIDPSYSHTCDPSVNHWHHGLDPDYHIAKTTIATAEGYRCIHVFDWDDWSKIVQLVKPKTAVYARKCTLKRIGTKAADEFTTKYHLQGKCRGQVENYGLYYEGELVEVMTFGKPRYTKKYDYELLRLCSKDDVRVVGGASRLFKAFIKDHPEASIISYCDLSKFTGKVYEEIGMKLHHITEPAKVWSRGLDKITDNLLRQRGFDQLFGTNYGKGTSNEALMLEDGWVPVCDCGQLVFEYKG